jgi:hypothetical protein
VTRRFGFAVSLVLVLALATPALGEPVGRTYGSKTWTWSFAADTLGLPPANTATFGGSWAVLVDSTRAFEAGGAPGGASASSADSVTGATVPASSADSTAVATALASAPRVLRQSEADDGLRFHYIQFKKPTLEDQAV